MLSFPSNSTYNSVTCDPVKTRLLKLEAEEEEPTNHNTWNQALRLDYSSASAYDTKNLVFRRL